MMRAHFVTFYSPGTFVAECTTKPIEAWDVAEAKQIAASITERHDARPYCFVFTTRERGDMDLDSHESNRSKRYYLGGSVLTLADIEARNDPADRVLISNMRCNNYARIVEGDGPNNWYWSQPFEDGDVVV